tara:strand:+ start:1032 stop:1268 length:237 start_codon:yes stop_codon:yes gene_type:complete
MSTKKVQESLTDQKLPEGEKPAHMVVNQSFFSISDREKRLIISEMLKFCSIQLSLMEGGIPTKIEDTTEQKPIENQPT